jgi:hypothetical protein
VEWRRENEAEERARCGLSACLREHASVLHSGSAARPRLVGDVRGEEGRRRWW